MLLLLLLVVATAVPAVAGERARSWRFDTARGAVRVFVPAGFDAGTASTIVYVHDYYLDVDRAWRTHQLRQRFTDAGINAMFIACEGPEDSAEPVSWRSLAWLLATVDRHVDAEVPREHVVAVAHGGGARAVVPWLAARELSTVVLVDAAFVDTSPHYRWSRARDHRLVEVADAAHWRSRLAHRLLPGAAIVDFDELEDVGHHRRVYVRTPRDDLTLDQSLPGALELVRAARLPTWAAPAPRPPRPSAGA